MSLQITVTVTESKHPLMLEKNGRMLYDGKLKVKKARQRQLHSRLSQRLGCETKLLQEPSFHLNLNKRECNEFS